jgi:hypothetical protein
MYKYPAKGYSIFTYNNNMLCIFTYNNNNSKILIFRNLVSFIFNHIPVAIPGDRNVIQNEAENILKYKNFTIEIKCMWNSKSKGNTSNNWNFRS